MPATPPDDILSLHDAMQASAEALDFEEARRLRDVISLLRGGASRDEVDQADTAGLDRQQPGSMGIGTSQPRPERPDGWVPPIKPDPMTRNRSRRSGR